MKSDHNRKNGFVLVVVLIAVALAMTAGGALVTASLHALQGERTAIYTERALFAADAASTEAVAGLNSTIVADMELGVTAYDSLLVHDFPVTISTTRITPLSILISASATGNNTTTTGVVRSVSRYIHFDAANIPAKAALTALGTLTGAPEIVADGRIPANDEDGEASCGQKIDTSSTTGVIATGTSGLDPIAVHAPDKISVLPLYVTDSLRTAFLQYLQSLGLTPETATGTTYLTPVAVGSECSPGSGEPRRSAGAVTACLGHWPVRMLTSADDTVRLGTSRHQGTLIIDGTLRLTGHLQIRGLLIVLGNLDATSGSIDAVGSVIVADRDGNGSALGNLSRVQWSRCALLRAVTPLATAAPPPVFSWTQRW